MPMVVVSWRRCSRRTGNGSRTGAPSCAARRADRAKAWYNQDIVLAYDFPRG